MVLSTLDFSLHLQMNLSEARDTTQKNKKKLTFMYNNLLLFDLQIFFIYNFHS